jgi:hypothetical protein
MDIRDCGKGEYVFLEGEEEVQALLCNQETLSRPKVSSQFKLTARTTGSPVDKRHFKGWRCEFKCVPPKVANTTTTIKQSPPVAPTKSSITAETGTVSRNNT